MNTNLNNHHPLQYTLPISRAAAEQWGIPRETHPAVAMAIHAISDATRSPQAIWEAPTPTECDHVAMAVQNYIDAGIFTAAEDRRYCWGCEGLEILGANAND